MEHKIINADCLLALKELDTGTIDCCVTSPPYYNQRDYGCEGQIGQEATEQEYIDTLIDVFKSLKRVLKDSGTCFVNLGDTYAGSGIGTTRNADINSYIQKSKRSYMMPNGSNRVAKYRNTGMNKSLLMIPYRFAWAMVQDGWILRNIIKMYRTRNMRPNPEGRNMRTTWSINTQPFRKAHFAVFPELLPSRIIDSGCPAGGVVLDPFMGAGTSALAAIKQGKRFIGIELNPEYIKIAKDRIHTECGLLL